MGVSYGLMEAATVKALLQGLLKAADDMLKRKDLPAKVKKDVTAVRASLKKRWDEMADDAAASDGNSQTATAEAATWLAEADGLLRQMDSTTRHVEMVSQAVRQKFQTRNVAGDTTEWVWVKDVFEDRGIAVYEKSAALWQVDYTVDETGDTPVVNFGTPERVDVAYIPVDGGDATEAATRAVGHLTEALTGVQEQIGTLLQGLSERAPVPAGGEMMPNGSWVDLVESAPLALAEFVPLNEAAVGKDGTVPIKIIQPGWGSSGYYSPAVLKRDGAKAFPKGTQMFADHPTMTEAKDRPERSVRDMVGVLSEDAKWRDDAKHGPGLYAKAKVFEPYRPVINELAPHIGTSILARGLALPGEAEGRKGKIIQEIAAGRSVDFVTLAGAGGKVVDLFEAARQGTGIPTAPATAATGETPSLTPQKEGTLMGAEEQLKEVQGSLASVSARLVRYEARDAVTAALAKTKLPEPARLRVMEKVLAALPLKEGALDTAALTTAITEAIKAETEYIKSVAGDSWGVRGLGETTPPDTNPAAIGEKLAAQFKRLGLSESGAKIAAAGR